MLSFLCKCKSITHIGSALDSPTQISSSLLPYLQSSYSSICCITTHQLSYNLEDLINSCGLSEHFRARCKSSENPNSVLNFLHSCGFSQTQVETLVSRFPKILFCDAEKTLKPKIDFFHSVGLSEADVPNIVTTCPRLLKRSLKNHLVPSFDLLRTSLGDRRKLAGLIRSYPFILSDSSKKLAPNLSTLRNLDIPQPLKSDLMIKLACMRILTQSEPSWLSKIVSATIKMGFDPLSSAFRNALKAMAFCTESTWEAKLELYRSLGFSDEDILHMFRKQPLAMVLSEETIRATVEFYVNCFHWTPSQLSNSPNVLLYSLEKRIIPRCLVLQVLVSRNRILVKKVKLITILVKTESQFLQGYVIKYKDEIPELFDVYQGKMKPTECNFDSEEMRRLSHCQILI